MSQSRSWDAGALRLATINVGDRTCAVRVEGDRGVDLRVGDLGELLRREDWRAFAAAADGPQIDLAHARYAPPITTPSKIICVGLNYRTHIAEMGRDLPTHPTLFAKFPLALVGAHDDIQLPVVSERLDWEAELAVVVGAPLRAASVAQAYRAIAGYTVINDVTARDYQHRTSQWLQGKTFEATSPIGPWLVASDGDDAAPSLKLTCTVNGEVVQQADTADMVFGPAQLLAYVSEIVTLLPGDVIATGTPGGVGHALSPPRYLVDGSVVGTSIEGIGECVNVCRLARGAKTKKTTKKPPAGR